MSKEEILDAIGNLSVFELKELLDEFEERFGVTAAAPAAAMMAMAPADSGAEEEEKVSFDVELTGAGDKKIGVIKVVRSLVAGLGLKEAKELVDSAPSVILEGVMKPEAEKAKAELEEAGATVELK